MGKKWTLDKRKYLDLTEVNRLLRKARTEMKRGIQERKYIQVRAWFTVLLGLYTGLRVSEMVALRNRDILINGSSGIVHVRKGKGGRTRFVRVGNEFLQAHADFTRCKTSSGITVLPESPVICKPNAEGLSTRSLQLAFKKCAKSSGLASHYSIHCLRHTYGTHLYVASGHNLRLVQKQLGHSTISVTEVYADVLEEEAQKAVSRLYK